jgi:HEAT repeat protein
METEMCNKSCCLVKAALLTFLLLSTETGFPQPPPNPTIVLWQYGVSNTIPSLRVALNNEHFEVRSLAAGLLAEDKDLEAIPLIQDALAKETDPRVTLSMRQALTTLKAWQPAPLLMKTCNDPNVDHIARLEAANRLLDLGGNQCLSSVLDLLDQSTDPPSRELSLQYLRKLSVAPPTAYMPKLQAFLLAELRDPVPMSRQYASDVLSLWGNQNAIPALEAAIAVETSVPTRDHLEESLIRLKSRF